MKVTYDFAFRGAFLLCAVTLMVLVGEPPADGGAVVCTSDAQCDDAVFCNGQEFCAPGNPSANAFGCVLPNADPCVNPCTCNEPSGSCEGGGCAGVDIDGDGHFSIGTGGDDCDDNDSNRFPGNPEVCDSGHDEDCDTSTFGQRDDDNDGWHADFCCNELIAGGIFFCGTDCNDALATINRTSPEVCNGLDDNCNSETDEGLPPVYVDADLDSWGDPAALQPFCSLAAGFSSRSGDCDENLWSINPNAPEICNGLDDNCNGIVDEGFPEPCS